MCTHIIYSFVGLNTDGSINILDTWNEIDKNALGRFVALKTKNPSLKVLVAIGGWNEGSLKYSNVVNNPTIRTAFVNNIVKFTKQYGFDGFDLDWEYPGDRGGAAVDKVNYVSLIKELRPLFDAEGFLLTAAVAATSKYHQTSYDVPNMSKYLDFINVMAYDLHGSYDGVTGQNAPLYASSIDSDLTLNVDASIRGWINSGAAPEKLILGIGVYGRTFTLSNAANNKLGASVSNAGNAGPYTAEAGMLGYNEICELIQAGGWTEVWDDEQKVPYIFKDNQWVGFDNQRSVELKSQYAIDMNLGGAMIWSLETDDSKNLCGSGKYPILQTINDFLKISSEGGIGATNSPIENTTLSATTTAGPTEEVSCSAAGFMRDPNNCSVFYRCVASGSSFTMSKFTCSNGLVFDVEKNVCNYPASVRC